MILRQSNKHLTKPEEYLTGKAHPSVFEGGWVDTLKMVKLAHDIRLDNIPPLVQLRVALEDKPLSGRDFFEPPGVWQQRQWAKDLGKGAYEVTQTFPHAGAFMVMLRVASRGVEFRHLPATDVFVAKDSKEEVKADAPKTNP